MLQHTTRDCLDNDYEEGEPTRIDISNAGLEANLLLSVVVGDKEADLLSLDLSIGNARNIAAALIAQANVAERNASGQ